MNHNTVIFFPTISNVQRLLALSLCYTKQVAGRNWPSAGGLLTQRINGKKHTGPCCEAHALLTPALTFERRERIPTLALRMHQGGARWPQVPECLGLVLHRVVFPAVIGIVYRPPTMHQHYAFTCIMSVCHHSITLIDAASDLTEDKRSAQAGALAGRGTEEYT